MQKSTVIGLYVLGALGSAVMVGLSAHVSADRFVSPSYTIDSSVGNSFGGSTGSTSYRMESSGGEAIVGDGASGSYKLGQGYIAQLEKSIELRVQPGTVAGYYAFDENFGTVAHDATLNTSNASLANTPSWVTGKIGRALSFNGTSQAASIPSATQNNIETVTISAWIKTSQSPAADAPIVSKRAATGAYPFSLRLRPTGTVSFAASDGANSPVVVSSDVVNDGAWHHITGVRVKGATLKVFIDGILAGSTNDTANSASTNTSAVGVAGEVSGSSYFSGAIDEVKIFNTALTDKEVSKAYAAENAGITSAQAFGDLLGGPQDISTLGLVQTDAPSYQVALQQDQDLMSNTGTIPAISGTIADPAAWSEGVTKGFGFTLTSGNDVAVKWGTEPTYNYAAIPSTSTSFYTRSGYTGGVKDQFNLQYRLDVASDQPAGDYKNTITYTATMQP